MTEASLIDCVSIFWFFHRFFQKMYYDDIFVTNTNYYLHVRVANCMSFSFHYQSIHHNSCVW